MKYLPVFFSITCIIMAFIGYKKHKNPICPSVVFNSLWAIILIISAFYRAVESTTNEVYMIIELGVLFFNVGLLSYRFIKPRVPAFKEKKTNSLNTLYSPRYRLLFACTLVCCLFYTYLLFSLMNNISIDSLLSIRSYIRSEDYATYSSKLLTALNTLFITPMSFALPIVAAVDFWYGTKNKPLIVSVSVMTLLETLSTGGRSHILIFLLYFFIVALTHNKNTMVIKKNKSINKKKKRKIIWMVGIVIPAGFIYTTISRGYSVMTNILNYFGIPPKMLEFWITEVDDSHCATWGFASLQGFIYPIFYIIKNAFGFNNLPSIVQTAWDVVKSTDTTWIYPGASIRANAFVTAFWFFYVDLRVVGVIVGSILWGRWAEICYRRCIKRQSPMAVAAYCVAFYTVFYSFCRFSFTLTGVALGLLYIRFFVYKRNKSI